MSLKSVKFLMVPFFLLTLAFCINAQQDPGSPIGRGTPNREDLPTGIQETLAKGRLKQAEKEYRDLLQRGEEAAKLSEELSLTLEATPKLSPADKKKLDRLEKLVKSIRGDLGGEEDEEENKTEAPEKIDFSDAIKNIKEDTASLLSEIKKIGRHTISVIAIKSTNSVLNLIRYLRFRTN